MAVKKCVCGKTKSPHDYCDGSHSNPNAQITKPHLIEELSARKLHSQSAGFEADDRGNTKFYPTAGVAVEGRKKNLKLPELVVIQVPQLNANPSVKYWVEHREGKYRDDTHKVVIDQLKILQQNGARILLYVDKEGFYDRAFSNSNGNSINIQELVDLTQMGYKIGEACYISKLICGVGGRCGPRGDMCSVCKDYSTGILEPRVIEKVNENDVVRKSTDAELVSYPTDFADDLRILVGKGTDYRILSGRIVNQENSRSFALKELLAMCNELKKGPRYVLEMLGVYREREAQTHTALKKADLGGH